MVCFMAAMAGKRRSRHQLFEFGDANAMAVDDGASIDYYLPAEEIITLSP